MLTFKRNTPEINASSTLNKYNKYNKYINQMTFKGIQEDDNIFNIDQDSARDALNVYVDTHDHFVSRPTLQKDKTIDATLDYLIENSGYKLIEIKSIGIGKVYVLSHIVPPATTPVYYIQIVNDITVTPISGATYLLDNIPKYHLSIIEHYIICFNNSTNGAQVYDTNHPENGWQSLELFVDIPVVKRVIGGQEFIYDNNNQFTNSYKEEYIWSNQSHPLLPHGYSSFSIKVNSDNSTNTLTVGNLTYAPEYKIVKPLPISFDVSAVRTITQAKNRICLAYDRYFQYSLNGGKTFVTQYYPTFVGNFKYIASISDDGQYFFFVASDGVYRCNLGDFTWTVDRINITSSGTYETFGDFSGDFNRCCKFLTGDIYCIMMYDSAHSDIRLYFKGPSLYSGTTSTNDNILTYISQIQNVNLASLLSTYSNLSTYDNRKRTNINIYIDNNSIISIGIVELNYGYSLNSPILRFIYIKGGDTSSYTGSSKMYAYSAPLDGTVGLFDTSDISGINILSGRDATEWIGPEQNAIKGDILGEFTLLSYENNTGKWWNSRFQIGYYEDRSSGTTRKYQSIAYVETTEISDDYELFSVYKPQYGYMLLKFTNGYKFQQYLYSDYDGVWTTGPTRLNSISLTHDYGTFINGDIYYSIYYSSGTGVDNIYTNYFLDDDTATITYSYTSTNKFTKVPNISYSDTELYLAFDNILQITKNNRDGTDIKFYLPKINDQTFIDKINAMINISTSEVALFFIDKITICSKVEDDTYGIRYAYYNTKLSTGVRLGDSVINTLEGSYTVFPTKRGLALMNYQAFMATTDQVLTYITDTIKHLWDKFYAASTSIKIIQWRNILVFTNGTKEILLYDIERTAWWRWEVPANVMSALTDQLVLKLITTNLFVFEDAARYYDYSKTKTTQTGAKTINWFYQSQPLHFSAPNYYKNLKQLIFQFYDESEDTTAKTMIAQIKLYRKKITLRDPEYVEFKIEEYRTFVKRFNYWKINELQWGLANDTETSTPKQLQLNAIGIKYEIGEEVR